MLGLIALYAIVFTYLTWKNFRLAVLLLIAALPAYLIRFSIGPLPSTLLELHFGIIFLIWLIKFSKNDWLVIQKFLQNNRFAAWSIALFFVASIASIFISDMWFYSLGQWRAYILEPLIFFFILLGQRFSPRNLALTLGISTLSISIVAILQKVTGSFYPPALWDDQFFGRVTSFFTSPNAVGLYIVPILLLSAVLENNHTKNLSWYIFASLGTIVILFTRSLGALGALAGGALVWLFFRGYKKIAIGIVTLGLLGALILPQTQALLINKEKSGSNRLVLWTYSWEYLTESPKNFVFGAGIRQFFRKVQKPHYDAEELERLIYPHNIFLNFWTELGLFGLLGFLGLYGALVAKAYKVWKNNVLLGAAVLAALAAFFAHGLLDVPYFKNDLAFLFWIMAAIIFLQKNPELGAQDTKK